MDGSSQAQEVHIQLLFFCRSTSVILCNSFIFSKPGFTLLLVLSAPLSQSLHVWLSQIVAECESELQTYMFFSCTSCKASFPLGTAVVQIIANNNMCFAKRLNSVIIWVITQGEVSSLNRCHCVLARKFLRLHSFPFLAQEMLRSE